MHERKRTLIHQWIVIAAVKKRLWGYYILNVKQKLYVYVTLYEMDKQYCSSMVHLSHSVKNLDFEICLPRIRYINISNCVIWSLIM